VLKCIQNEVGTPVAADSPADDVPGKDVNDKGDRQNALPGADIGEVTDPPRMGTLCQELAIDLVLRTRPRAISGTVVRTTLPRRAPCRPRCFSKRSTVQRATTIPSRFNG